VLQAHAPQDVWGFGELDIVIANNLHPVPPRIAKVKERARQRRDTRSLEGGACRFLVVDDEAEMATVVWRLLAPLFEGR